MFERFAAPARPERMIVIAIDDNAQAWYEMLIPFVLSLRRTDYDGRLGVISYGLSEQKHQVLAGAGIAVFAPAGEENLACDRLLAAARIIAADPAISVLTLYDADIWFPTPRFDLFEQMADDVSLHLAPDVAFSTFILAPIAPHADDLRQQCHEGVLQRLGHPLQAGMVMGARAAWADFGAAMEGLLARIGVDFTPVYGLDTTFLHLWAAQDRVRLVPAVYNFIPQWGLHECHNMFGDGEIFFEHGGQRVQALHMAGQNRFYNRWRYYALHPDSALAEGAALCPPHDGQRTRHAHPQAQSAFAALGFTQAEALGSAALAIHRTDLPHDGLMVSSWGPLELHLVPGGDMVMQFLTGFLNNQPSAPIIEIWDGDQLIARGGATIAMDLTVPAGARLTFRSLSLPGQICHQAWNFAARPYSG